MPISRKALHTPILCGNGSTLVLGSGPSDSRLCRSPGSRRGSFDQIGSGMRTTAAIFSVCQWHPLNSRHPDGFPGRGSVHGSNQDVHDEPALGRPIGTTPCKP
jgi:hypothetical protein